MQLLGNSGSTYTDQVTAASSTAANSYSFNQIGQTTLNAKNTGVTTTTASSLLIAGPPVAGLNQTITNPYAVNVQSGVSNFSGPLRFSLTPTGAGINLTTPSSITSSYAMTLPATVPSLAGRSLVGDTSANLTWGPLPIGTVKQTLFTASGTYTPTTNMVYAMVEVVGGGGGGGGSQSGSGASVGGAGGGGVYASSILSAATIGSSQTVTIGAGGAGGAAGSNNGGAGGTSSVGSLINATGGYGGNTNGSLTGSYDGTIGAQGGVTGKGQIVKIGFPGSFGSVRGTSGVLYAWSGVGGASGAGTNAGTGQQVGTSSSGSPAAANTGAGGNGGISTTSANAGGNGGSGYVLITEYINA